MLELIGKTAGQVWESLTKEGEMSLPQLRKAVDADDFLLNSAIGWLAREEKLQVTKKGNSIKISLK